MLAKAGGERRANVRIKDAGGPVQDGGRGKCVAAGRGSRMRANNTFEKVAAASKPNSGNKMDGTSEW